MINYSQRIDNLLNLAVEVITQKRVKQKMEINVLENCYNILEKEAHKIK